MPSSAETSLPESRPSECPPSIVVTRVKPSPPKTLEKKEETDCVSNIEVQEQISLPQTRGGANLPRDEVGVAYRSLLVVELFVGGVLGAYWGTDIPPVFVGQIYPALDAMLETEETHGKCEACGVGRTRTHAASMAQPLPRRCKTQNEHATSAEGKQKGHFGAGNGACFAICPRQPAFRGNRWKIPAPIPT
jgi:hypothetical protein